VAQQHILTDEEEAASVLKAAIAELQGVLPRSSERYEQRLSHPVLASTRSRFWPTAIYTERARGAYLYDIDGREYIDCNMGHGPLILGHCHPAVVSALETQLVKGSHFGPPSRHELELADIIAQWVPGVERVAFTNSGGESTMAAVRIARAATGREKVAKFEGGLHGNYDPLLFSVLTFAGDPEHPEPNPDSAGLPYTITDNVVMLPFNSGSAFDRIRAEGEQLACVIVEPLQGSAGSLTTSKEFLQQLRTVCDEVGAFLIFDEVITGFRLGPRSGAGTFDVTADLTTLGKAIGGGLPVGAVCGRGDLIDLTASPLERPVKEAVFVGGTFSGNPLTTAAGAAQLSELIEHQEYYAHLDHLGERMREGLRAILQNLNIRGYVTGHGSIWGGPYFTPSAPSTIRDIAQGNELAARLLSIYLLLDGVLITGTPHLNFLSAAHTDDDVDRVLLAHEKAIKRLQKEGHV
jgi:glutamate-1-semialdehyde 2,1-aminomutase